MGSFVAVEDRWVPSSPSSSDPTGSRLALTIYAPLLRGRRRRFGLREIMAPVGVVDLGSDDDAAADWCCYRSMLLPSIGVGDAVAAIADR
ncbi:hypothetical protein ACLOJK_005479 [Asimina triloba]